MLSKINSDDGQEGKKLILLCLGVKVQSFGCTFKKKEKITTIFIKCFG
jgi:hypothetical protein